MLLPWLRNQNLTISVRVSLFRFAFDLKFRKSRNVDLIWKGDLKLMNNGHVIATSRHVYIADSAQTEYCTTFPLSVCSCVRPCVTGVTSHISHIYKGINAMLIIRDPSTPIYSESKSSWLSF